MRVVNSTVVYGSGGNCRPKDGNGTAPGSGGPKIPRGLRNLPIAGMAPASAPKSELDALKAEAQDIEQWWSTPRWQYTKRVYSGECCVEVCCEVAIAIAITQVV